MNRRYFLRTAAALPLAGGLPLGALPTGGSTSQRDTLRQAYPTSIDGLGEIRLDYEPALWSAEDVVRIRSNGLWRNVASEVLGMAAKFLKR